MRSELQVSVFRGLGEEHLMSMLRKQHDLLMATLKTTNGTHPPSRPGSPVGW